MAKKEEPATGEVQTGAEKFSPDRNLFQRLNAVMREVTYIQKEKKAGMRYSIVSHDAVTAKIRPSFVNHGIVYFPYHIDMKQSGNRTECTMLVKFANIDDPEDHIVVASAGYGIDDQDKGPGKAISYAVKYALLKALGLESGDDPDDDQETTYRNPEAENLQRKHELAIEDATGTEALATIDGQVRADYGAHKLDKATASGLIGKIKQKAATLAS